MEEIRDEIYKCIDENYMSAVLVQRSWAKKVAEREISRRHDVSRRSESTHYDFRIEFNGSSFLLRWFNVKFVRTGSKTLRIVKSIALPRNGCYKPAQFKHAEKWELECIDQMEVVLCDIRNQVKHLMKAHQSILWASKCRGNAAIKTLKAVPIIDRVEPSPYSVKEFKKRL